MKLAPEIKWGLVIGFANMAWLYLSYFLGMHTSGLGLVQAMTGISLGITFAGFLFGLRAVSRSEGGITFLDGIRSGSIIAAVMAAVAVVTQLGYFTVIHPGWTDYMVEETRRHYEGRNFSPEELDEAVAQAKVAFGLKSYLLQSVLGALITGMIFTAIIMLFIRTRRPRGA